jgi:hypothetical protein
MTDETPSAAAVARVEEILGTCHCDGRTARGTMMYEPACVWCDHGDKTALALDIFAREREAAVWEAAAKFCDRIVKEHRDGQGEHYGDEHLDETDGVLKVHTDATGGEDALIHRCGGPGYFCEDFGCGSFEELASQFRARAAEARRTP